MAVTTTNLVQGPAELFVAQFGATEPADTAAALAIDPPAPWTCIGATTKGVTLTFDQTYDILNVDQIPDNVGARMSARSVTVATQMAELTLQNLAVALNGGTVASATGVQTYDPLTGDSSTQPVYNALIIDGWAPVGASGVPVKRRVILRKVLSTKGAELVYDKTDMAVYKVTLSCFYVSASVKPFHIVEGLGS